MSDVQRGGGPAGPLPFIYGHVDPTLFPATLLAEAATAALHEHSQAALNYNRALGASSLRAFLRAKLARDENLLIEPDEIMLTGRGVGRAGHGRPRLYPAGRHCAGRGAELSRGAGYHPRLSGQVGGRAA